MKVSHLIKDVLGAGRTHAGNPRAIQPRRLYITMCGKRLPGQGFDWVMTFKDSDTDCEDCLAALALEALAEVP